MRVRDSRVAQRQDGRQGAEHGVAVVGAATAIEPVAPDHRDPRSQTLRPAGHLRLLVQVAVEQHAVGALAGNVDQDHRSAALEPHHLEGGPLQGFDLAPGPGREQLHRLVHVSVGGPIRVEGRALVGDPDVVDQGRHHFGVPHALDEAGEPGDVGAGGGEIGHGTVLWRRADPRRIAPSRQTTPCRTVQVKTRLLPSSST